jgi:hypothetical protein
LITAADASGDDKKRKRGEAAAGDIIMHVSKSLDSCTGVLHRAGTLYKGDKDSLLLILHLLLLLFPLLLDLSMSFFLQPLYPILRSILSHPNSLLILSSHQMVALLHNHLLLSLII